MNNIETNELTRLSEARDLPKAEPQAASHRSLVVPGAAPFTTPVAEVPAQTRPAISPSTLRFRPLHRHWGINE
jgi:hypothetical protein